MKVDIPLSKETASIQFKIILNRSFRSTDETLTDNINRVLSGHRSNGSNVATPYFSGLLNWSLKDGFSFVTYPGQISEEGRNINKMFKDALCINVN